MLFQLILGKLHCVSIKLSKDRRTKETACCKKRKKHLPPLSGCGLANPIGASAVGLILRGHCQIQFRPFALPCPDFTIQPYPWLFWLLWLDSHIGLTMYTGARLPLRSSGRRYPRSARISKSCLTWSTLSRGHRLVLGQDGSAYEERRRLRCCRGVRKRYQAG